MGGIQTWQQNQLSQKTLFMEQQEGKGGLVSLFLMIMITLVIKEFKSY